VPTRWLSQNGNLIALRFTFEIPELLLETFLNINIIVGQDFCLVYRSF